MKLTIETTTDKYNKNGYGKKVTIELPYDDVGLDEIIEEFRKLLIAYGFSGKQIDEYFGEGEE